MKIVVLCGGLSPERNVSLSSGAGIARALSKLGHEVVAADMYIGLENWRGELKDIFASPPPLPDTRVSEETPDLEALKRSRRLGGNSLVGDRIFELCAMADIVYLALHGQCGEDGRIQAALDLMGVPYTGSGFLGSAVSMDKVLTKLALAPLGVLMPEWSVYRGESAELDAAAGEITLPCVVKPASSGSSIGVSIVRERDKLRPALDLAAAEGGKILVERFIEGREIQVAVLENRALPSIEIRPGSEFYDYRDKYQPGRAQELCPAPIAERDEARVRELALSIHNALGLCACSRSDFILDSAGNFWFLEINTLPGMTPVSLMPQEAAAAGIDYGELCGRILNASLERFK